MLDHESTMEACIRAIRNGDGDALQELLRDFSDCNALLSAVIKNANVTNHAIGKAMTLLQFASYRTWEGYDSTETLIAAGATLDLHSAAGLGRVSRIEEILSADGRAFDRQIDTYVPLQFAITANQPASIDCLLKHGENANRNLKKVAYFGWEDESVDQDYTPWRPIHMASLWGFDHTRIPTLKALIDGGADVNAVSPLDGFRPIHLVAMPNRVDMIRFLVANGVDVDSRTQACEVVRPSEGNEGPIRGFDCTPLMVACGEGFLEATECLLELGADVNSRNDRGQTALHFAARRKWNGQPYDAIFDALIAAGADQQARDDEGNPPARG